MATKGLWNIGSFNLPDFGISEALNIGPRNASIDAPQMSTWPQSNISIPSNIKLSPNASPALVANQSSSPTPTQKSYSATPAPQPSGINPNDAGSIRAQFPGYAGWSDASMLADFKNTQGAGKGGSPSTGDALNSEWEQLYGETLNQYGSIESMYNTQAQGAREGLTAEGNSAKSAYEEALRRSNEQLATQRTGLDQSQEHLNSEAIRQYNAALQRAQQQFGGGSSTGGAIGELAMQAFMRTQGDLRQKYVAGQLEIQKAERDTDYNYNAALKDLNDKLTSGFREIQNNLTASINEIELKKAQLADDKRAARIQAMMTANEQNRQLEAIKENRLYDLGKWALERKADMGGAQKIMDELVANLQANLKIQQTSMANEIPELKASTSFNQFSLNRNNLSDPYSELINQ